MVGQEPVFDSPINLGSHCAKGRPCATTASRTIRARLKYPMKLVNGKYQRISWDEALDGITAKMMAIRRIRTRRRYFVGSSKHGNEQAFLLRKFVSLWARTIAITRPASAIPLRSPAWPTPGATAR